MQSFAVRINKTRNVGKRWSKTWKCCIYIAPFPYEYAQRRITMISLERIKLQCTTTTTNFFNSVGFWNDQPRAVLRYCVTERRSKLSSDSFWMDFKVNTFTPKSDQVQISPVASPVILRHTVWRTWLFIAYSDWKMILVPVLTTSLIHFSWKGCENVLFELGIARVNERQTWPSRETA